MGHYEQVERIQIWDLLCVSVSWCFWTPPPPSIEAFCHSFVLIYGDGCSNQRYNHFWAFGYGNDLTVLLLLIFFLLVISLFGIVYFYHGSLIFASKHIFELYSRILAAISRHTDLKTKYKIAGRWTERLRKQMLLLMLFTFELNQIMSKRIQKQLFLSFKSPFWKQELCQGCHNFEIFCKLLYTNPIL